MVLAANIPRFLYFIVPVLVFASCTSSKDIYQNPYSAGIEKPGGNHVISRVETNISSRPDWIYAVSSEFYVGYGQGYSIIEAKNAALADIKAFLTRSLGETGTVKEIALVSNSITGRKSASGREDYYLAYEFENEYRPVIRISFDRLNDFYYEYAGYQARYFIKYEINEAGLNQIRDEFRRFMEEQEARIKKEEEERQRLLRAERLRKMQIRRSIDSLTSISDFVSVESLLERYHGITSFLYEIELSDSDSLLLLDNLRYLADYLGNAEIRVVEHDPGAYLRFGLFSGNILLRSNSRPFIMRDGRNAEDLFEEDGIWEYTYLKDQIQEGGQDVVIIYELPYDRIEKVIRIGSEKPVPEWQVTDGAAISELEVNEWNGKIKSFIVDFILKETIPGPFRIRSMDLELHTGGATNPVFSFQPTDKAASSGNTHIVKKIDCQLPTWYFAKNEITCDLRVNYILGETLQSFDIHNINIKINH